MNWIIERDPKDGLPCRLWWAGNGPRKRSKKEIEQERLAQINALPMPAMRDWYKAKVKPVS